MDKRLENHLLFTITRCNSHVEKSTSDNSGSNLNAVKSDEEVKQCLIDDPECEACQ